MDDDSNWYDSDDSERVYAASIASVVGEGSFTVTTRTEEDMYALLCTLLNGGAHYDKYKKLWMIGPEN